MAPMRTHSTAIAQARRSANTNTLMDLSQNHPTTSNAAGTSPNQVKGGNYPLQRGSACLSCRKRKMKCDAAKPVCQQCVKGNRALECEYDDGKSKSRTQMLQEKVSKLQDRIKELETRPSRHSSTSPPSPASSTMQPTSSYPPLMAAGTHHGFDSDPYASSSHALPVSSYDSGLFPGQHLDLPYHATQTIYSSASSSGSASPGPDFGVSASAAPSWGLRTENDGQWWTHEDLTPHWRQTLLELFLPHRHQASFVVHLPTFISNINQPANSPLRPHPALLNTIYLLATHFAPSPNLSSLESIFLDRALSHLSTALEHSDRLVNVIQASCLLASWFFGKGRLLEGYYHASSAGRLAIGLGLHQIRSDSFPPLEVESGLLPQPRSKMELGERILAFWQVFNVDRCWAVATGLPSGLSDDDHPRTRIMTVWPREIEGYIDGSSLSFDQSQAYHQTQASLRSLFPPHSSNSATKDSVPTLRAKATAYFERASRLSASYEQKTQSSSSSSAPSAQQDKFWAEFRSLNYAISQFLSFLPPIPARNPSSDPSTRATLLIVHSLAQVALIQLHHTFSTKDMAAHEKCLEAAFVVLGIIPMMDESDYKFLDPIMGTCWMCVSDILLREQLRRAHTSEGMSVNRELDTVVNALKLLGTVFPLAGYQVTKVEQGRMDMTF